MTTREDADSFMGYVKLQNVERICTPDKAVFRALQTTSAFGTTFLRRRAWATRMEVRQRDSPQWIRAEIGT